MMCTVLAANSLMSLYKWSCPAPSQTLLSASRALAYHGGSARSGTFSVDSGRGSPISSVTGVFETMDDNHDKFDDGTVETSRPQAIYGHRYPCPALFDGGQVERKQGSGPEGDEVL